MSPSRSPSGMSRAEAVARGEEGYEAFLPHLAVDCVIFGFHEGELKVLLMRWKHATGWSLPGGYVERHRSLDEAAHRVLQQRTGLDQIYLQQFHTFGGTDRRESTLLSTFEGLGLPVPEGAWFLDRVVSVGYYALVDFTRAAPTPDLYSEACAWWDVLDHPPLLFDHDEMIHRALRRLREGLSYRPIGLNLLPETFTLPELQGLYETLLGRKLDRRNFQRKIQALGIVERLEERRTGGAHRAPYLYRFLRDRYDEALQHGLGFSA